MYFKMKRFYKIAVYFLIKFFFKFFDSHEDRTNYDL